MVLVVSGELFIGWVMIFEKLFVNSEVRFVISI